MTDEHGTEQVDVPGGAPGHEAGQRKGEEIASQEGRDDAGKDMGETGAGRPAGSRNDPPDPSGGPNT